MVYKRQPPECTQILGNSTLIACNCLLADSDLEQTYIKEQQLDKKYGIVSLYSKPQPVAMKVTAKNKCPAQKDQKAISNVTNKPIFTSMP